MHIALLSRGGTGWLGGGQYIKGIVYALKTLPPEKRELLRISLLVTGRSETSYFKDLEGVADHVVDAESAMSPYSLRNRVRWKSKRMFSTSIHPRLEEFLRHQGVDFAYPCRLNRVCLPYLRFADWIPDFQYDHYPDGSNPEEIAARKADWAFVTENVPHIVLSSRMAESDCLRLFPNAKGKTSVLRFRVSFPKEHLEHDVASVVREYNLPNDFFLVSNLFAPTKNHIVVFRALADLKSREVRPTVVCTGDLHDYRNPGFSNEVLQSIHKSGVASQVRLLGIIPRWKQIQLMRQAVAVIQPSLFEGWNTSLEEGRCLGKKLIVSDIPVHREQDPPGATYFDPSSAEALAIAMEQALEQGPFGFNAEHEEAAVADYKRLVDDFGDAFLLLAAGA